MTTFNSYENVLVALCLWREARGEPRESIRAIYHVIQNRFMDPASRWPSTRTGAILQKFQFSSFSKDDPNATLLPDPRQYRDWKAWAVCCSIVDDPGDDPTGGANHYHSSPDDKLPTWAIGQTPSVAIGPFRFYQL